MSKVYYTTQNYTVQSTGLINKFSRDVVSRDSGLMKVRAGRDAWDLKVNCEASLLADSIGVERGRAVDRRAKRK